MKCLMHKSMCLKNSKLEKLFEVSVIYSVNSLFFYQHSAQHSARDGNSALESDYSISPYISLLCTYRKTLTVRKDVSCQIHLRVKSWRGFQTPQRDPKAQPQTLGKWERVQASSSLPIWGTLISSPMPSCAGFGVQCDSLEVAGTPFPC